MSIFSSIKDFFTPKTSSASSGDFNSFISSATNKSSNSFLSNYQPPAPKSSIPTTAITKEGYGYSPYTPPAPTPTYKLPESKFNIVAKGGGPLNQTSQAIANRMSSSNLSDTTAPTTDLYPTDDSLGLNSYDQYTSTTAPTPTTSGRDKVLDSILGNYEKLGTKGSRLEELRGELGYKDASQKVADLNAQYDRVKRGYEKKIEELRQGEGKTKAFLNMEISDLARKGSQHLADIAIEQQAALGNFNVVNDIVNTQIEAEFQPLKDQIEALKTYADIYGDDLTESEKMNLQFSLDTQQTEYEQQVEDAKNSKLASFYQQQYDAGEMSAKDIPIGVVPFMNTTVRSKYTAEMVDPLIDKSIKIDNLLADTEGLKAAVGPNAFARMNLSEAFTNQRGNFVSKVQQMLSQETLDTLVNLKRAGGTLGALSDSERVMLQNAASNISGNAIKDENGDVVGYSMTEKQFNSSMRELQRLTDKALLRADIVPAEKKAEILTKQISRDNPSLSQEDVKSAVKEILPTYISNFSSVGNTKASTIANAIKTVESQGNYNARGQSGEFGAYQFMPNTWKQWAGEFLGDPNAKPTPQNQDLVAQSKINQLINQGYNAQQIALIWNGGTPTPKKGVNKFGVKYDSGAYANKVINQLRA